METYDYFTVPIGLGAGAPATSSNRGTEGQVLTADANGRPTFDDLPETGVTAETFTGNGTWTKPSGCTAVLVEVIGSGGGGGGGIESNVNNKVGGTGGGGGTYAVRMILAADLAATVAVTVGASAAGGGVGAAGTAGNLSSFGAHVIAYGGGRGVAGNAGSSSSGGGGGGVGGAGANGGAGAAAGGAPYFTGAGSGVSHGGGGSPVAGVGEPAEWGGGGGGGAETDGAATGNPFAGGTSIWGGGGGGAGGGAEGAAEVAGAAGGAVLTYSLAGGGGGTAGTVGGGAGGAGAAGNSTKCGQGGGGGGGEQTSGSNGGTGGAGGAPGGGGGGAAAAPPPGRAWQDPAARALAARCGSMLGDILTYGGAGLTAGTKLGGGLMSLLNGDPSALAGAGLSLAPTAMSLTGSALGGSASSGLSALAAGAAPGVASALSLGAIPAALIAYFGSQKLMEQMQSKKKQAGAQMMELQDAYRALPGRVQARQAGAGALGHLADFSSPDRLTAGLQATHGGIQADLERMPLSKALDLVMRGGDDTVRDVHGSKVPAPRADLAAARDALMGPGATDNYVGQLLLTDAAGRQGLDTAPYQTWTHEGAGAGGGQYERDSAGNVTGYVTGEGERTAGPANDAPWTWDDDFLNNAVATIGGQVGIDPSKLPGATGLQEYQVTDPASGDSRWETAAAGMDLSGMVSRPETNALTAADLPGWGAGNYGGAIDAYLRSLDPTIVESDAYKRYQALPGLAGLFS